MCPEVAALGRCILSSYLNKTLTSQRPSDQREVQEVGAGGEVLHVGAGRLHVPEVRVWRRQRSDAASYRLLDQHDASLRAFWWVCGKNE